MLRDCFFLPKHIPQGVVSCAIFYWAWYLFFLSYLMSLTVFIFCASTRNGEFQERPSLQTSTAYEHFRRRPACSPRPHCLSPQTFASFGAIKILPLFSNAFASLPGILDLRRSLGTCLDFGPKFNRSCALSCFARSPAPFLKAIAGQAEVHEEWGGVVPGLARDSHALKMDGVVDRALEQAGMSSVDEVDAVAVTVRDSRFHGATQTVCVANQASRGRGSGSLEAIVSQ